MMMTGGQKCKTIAITYSSISMWSDIIHAFADSPSQSLVVRFLLQSGFGVNENGKIVCNGIEIPATHLARAIGADRRVVDATAQRILASPLLRDIFLSLRATPDLSHVAENLGLSVLTILPRNAQEKGIVSSTVKVLADADVNIRQIFVTDPYLAEDPKLVIIIDDVLPLGVIETIRSLPQVRQVIF